MFAHNSALSEKKKELLCLSLVEGVLISNQTQLLDIASPIIVDYVFAESKSEKDLSK